MWAKNFGSLEGKSPEGFLSVQNPKLKLIKPNLPFLTLNKIITNILT